MNEYGGGVGVENDSGPETFRKWSTGNTPSLELCPKDTKQQKIVLARIETLLYSWPWSDNNLFRQ